MRLGNTFDPGNGEYTNVDGNMVENDTLAIAERIKAYDENLVILCINPSSSDINEAPFVVCERRPDGTLNRIFEAWKLDESVLERIALADGHKFDLTTRFETIANMQKKLSDDRYKDTAGEAAEVLEAAVRNRTSSFTFKNRQDDLIRIHEHKPRERVGLSYFET